MPAMSANPMRNLNTPRAKAIPARKGDDLHGINGVDEILRTYNQEYVRYIDAMAQQYPQAPPWEE